MCEAGINMEEVKNRFESTFNLLYGALGEDSFKKYNGTKHVGPVMASAYQAIATGIYYNIDAILDLPNKSEWLIQKVRELYSQPVFEKNTTPGTKSTPRFKDLSLFGIDYFKP